MTVQVIHKYFSIYIWLPLSVILYIFCLVSPTKTTTTTPPPPPTTTTTTTTTTASTTATTTTACDAAWALDGSCEWRQQQYSGSEGLRSTDHAEVGG